ncbi:PKD domain-containing protein [Marinigracilibium pacificum]|uniref:PKD domain-containing protein n=1 Tax=Marinigracilibium pacificum TaxID=2729599 RepID=A0A848J038_9BACT|nr:PKD domain-containing protein [Marinigracilibium pacificum]NMM48885.1 PKD domain-containing protein [Marinigracilibium pacificum]
MKLLNINQYWTLSKISILITLVVLSSCDLTFELPEEGSLPDKTPPKANFSASQNEADYLLYSFSNESISATDFQWDFGDGNTSTDKDGINTFPAEGKYTVTLTASDKLGVVDSYSMEIEVIEPEAPAAIIPVILEGGFEDGALPDGTGDGRDSWRNDFGDVIQITSSPVHEGSQAAKFPSTGDRIAYQEMAVTPNTDYMLTYYYTLKTDIPGSVTVTVLANGITNLSEVPNATLAAFEGTDQTDADTYERVDLPFNSGANTQIALLITNKDVEGRVDAMSFSLIE